MYLVNYLPILTTLLCIYFFILLLRHWQGQREALHIFWWMLGVFFYGAGTVTESINTLFGFSTLNFKAWYILGALLGGAPLAQGTVYLLMKRKTANILATILVTIICLSSVLVILSPINHELVTAHARLSGKFLTWRFVRLITPFINLYAFFFLVGGAIWSAWKYAKENSYKNRFKGNLFIALGGLLPGIGGSFTRFGYVEVLYITELIGIILIFTGYRLMKGDLDPSVHFNQTYLAT